MSIPTTESSNPASERIDALSSLEIVQLMNQEDAKVAHAVALEAEAIAKAIEIVTERMRRGGRLIYMGAGTSGRLGVLDATECPPTFNTHPDQVVGLIAGGYEAVTRAVEGAEDHPEFAVADLKQVKLTDKDVVFGIASSGRTPYVLGGLEYAKQVGAAAIGLACNGGSELAKVSEVIIAPLVGPEVISGSTRLKAGTATKMVLNMVTTGTMVMLGKTYGNYMVDLRATNTKLVARTRRIFAQLTGTNEQEAGRHLDACQGELKTAIVAHRHKLTAEQARSLLAKHQGKLRAALEQA
ncbi:MAG: N-acetylmuramic acid 6-phosphate etherase [Pirellulales bacterium]